MDQGKKRPQLEDAEAFAFIAFILLTITFIILTLIN
jgi:hypothetical protein